MKETLIEMLIQNNIVKIKQPNEELFTLKSGNTSRFFFNVKEASVNPTLLHELLPRIYNLGVISYCDSIASVPVGSTPIASAISFDMKIPQVIVRSEKHTTGTKSKIIGNCKNQHIILIEDVSTSGNTLVNAVNDIRNAGGTCNHCIVIIDRQEGATELCQQNNITLHPLLTKSDFGIEESTC